MTPHRLVGINTSIGGREQSEIIKVLDNYNLVPDKIERVRSAYKIICGSACYYLKKTNHGDKKAYKVMQLIHYLKNNHFSNIADYIKTKDNKECIKKNHCIYYMTQWIEGKESDFDDLEEIKKAAMLLAQFHISAKGFYVDGLKIPSNIKNWPLILSERKEDLIYFKKAIENKKIKTSFDAQYGSLIPFFKERSETSIQLMERSDYANISKAAKAQRTICHDSYYYQNILVDNENKMYIVDLDSALYDITVYDLAKFLRRILYKKIYSWDFNIGKAVIDAYNEIKPLSKEEYDILLAFIIFPHKFWRLGKKRYAKKKSWSEDKYLRKLRKILKYKDRQDEFINQYIQHFGSNT